MRRSLVAASVLVAVIILFSVWWSRSRPSPDVPAVSSARPPATHADGGAAVSNTVLTQGQLEKEILIDGLTPERAKHLFSIVVGPLPGVAITATPSRDPADFDGTSAILNLYQVWNTLTPDQQRAAEKLINGGGHASEYAHRNLPKMLPVGFHLVGDPQPAYDYGELLVNADLVLEKMLGVPHVRIEWETDFNPPQGTEYAHTDSWYSDSGQIKPYPGNKCHIVVHDQKMSTLTSDDDAKAVMTHEMFHCYQGRAAGSYDIMANLRAWIKEGEPTWVMAAVVSAAGVVIAKDWQGYADFPATRFHQRGQDAIGVFGHLSDRAGDGAVWDKLLRLVVDGAQDKYGFAAFDDLIAGREDDYYTSWASSYFLAKQKTDWTMSGPAHPPDSGPAPQKVSVDVDDPRLLTPGGPFESQLFELTTNADVLEIALLTGYGRVHDKDFGLDTALTTSGMLALCVKSGGCTCPDGSPGASMFTKKATAPISVGVNGGRAAAEIGVGGQSLDDFCKKPKDKHDPPDFGGGGGGGGGGDNPFEPFQPTDPGSSASDTHVLTFDGLKYDFQVVGEYTLVRSTKDDFIVQTRQVPVLKSRTVTVNQAMATKIAGRRVTIALENDQPVLRIDGSTVTDALPTFAGGSIVRSTSMYGTAYSLEWNDGTTVSVEQLGPRVLNVQVTPGPARKGALAGLLGNADGSPDNDLVGSNGIALPLQTTPAGPRPSPEDVTHKLADAWRVTPSTSLFDYLPGQSTATFVDSTFPESHVDPSRVPNRESAEKNCREAGITDARLLDNCIVDFGITSDFLFTSSYSHQQQVLAAHERLTAKTSGILRTVMFQGSTSDPASQPSAQFDAKAGDIVWIGQPDCVDSQLPIFFRAPDGKGLGNGWACTIGRVLLPLNGTYTVKASSSNNPAGTYRVPLRLVRPDRTRAIAPNDIVSDRIETRGAHDLYSFDGHAGDVVRIAGEGCNLNSMAVGFLLPNGADVLGPNCRAGSDSRLTMTGPYRLVVNAADGGAGEYHFVFQVAGSTSQK